VVSSTRLSLTFLWAHHLFQVGKYVILYAILRFDLPVVRAKIVSIDPNRNVGGQPLGNEYCEVIVNLVMKRDAMLTRPYGEIQTITSADKMRIEWPLNKVMAKT
jgi:hypothetical protein